MAATDVSYLNPTSIAPKFNWQPENALAGMEWVQNREDYRNLLAQQMRLQALAEKERGMDVSEKEKNLPLLELQRQGKIAQETGALPFQGQLGATGAQATIADNRLKSSPERQAFEIDKFKQGMNDNQWQQYTRSMAVVGPMIEQAMQLAKTQGPMAAQQWIQQNASMAKRAGVDLPPYINDPKSWEPLYNAAVQTAKHAQEIRKIDREGMYRQNVAEINGGFNLQQGRERNESNERIAGMNVQGRQNVADSNSRNRQQKFSTDQRINALADEISQIPEGQPVDPRKVSELAMALDREYEKINAQGAPLRQMAPEMQRAFQQQKQNYVQQRLETLGIQQVQRPNPAAPQGATPGQRPPLSSFERAK